VLTRIELRDMNFRDTVQAMTGPIERYQRTCARGESVHGFFFNRHAGIYVGASFPQSVARHRRELMQR
jgi:hypothetical protein